MVLQVTAPLVIVKDATGRMHHFYRDSILPGGLDGDHVAQLVQDGMVEETANPTISEAPTRPAKSASKDEWIAYARVRGASDAEIDGKTKDALIEAFGD